MRRLSFVLATCLFFLASCAGSPPTEPTETATQPPPIDPVTEPDTEPTSEPQPELESTPQQPTTLQPNSSSPPVEVGVFTSDELFASGGGGCGMSLWVPGTEPWTDGNLFFHGMDDEPAFMTLNGQLTQLKRTGASGEAFYGQKTVQTFLTEDGETRVNIDVTLGPSGGFESIDISAATITVEKGDQPQEIAAVGDAGC